MKDVLVGIFGIMVGFFVVYGVILAAVGVFLWPFTHFIMFAVGSAFGYDPTALHSFGVSVGLFFIFNMKGG